MTIVQSRLGALAASVWFAVVATMEWWQGRTQVDYLVCIQRVGEVGCGGLGTGWAHRAWGVAALALWTVSLVLAVLAVRDRRAVRFAAR